MDGDDLINKKPSELQVAFRWLFSTHSRWFSVENPIALPAKKYNTLTFCCQQATNSIPKTHSSVLSDLANDI